MSPHEHMGTAMGRISLHDAAIVAFLLASALTAAEIGAVLVNAPRLQVAAGRWAHSPPAMLDKAVCRWGITAGYGQPVCGAFGISAFPPTSARPVAIWLAPTILSGTVSRAGTTG